jgi:hypothetical protein
MVGVRKNEKSAKTCAPRVPNTLVTLTHPYLLVTFRLKAFSFWYLAFFSHLTREGTRAVLPRR